MNRAFRTTIQALALAACGLALTAAAQEAPAAPAPAAAVVHIANFTFDRTALTVSVGTTVTWINDDDVPHTVVAKDMAFRSKVLDTGERFSFTFAKAGRFDYFCSLHPHMTGAVLVRA